MELKDRIALARKQAGLSQEQLGEQLGVSRQAVSKWESGQANPDVDYLTRMLCLKYSMVVEGSSDGDPVEVLYQDRGLLLSGAAFAALTLALLYLR